MGHKKRIIPCLDVDAGRVVKGVQFRCLRDAGDPVELALRYREEGADEIVFLDITATTRKRAILKELVSAVAHDLDIPFTVGGGLRTFEDVEEILLSGADKISLNSAAVFEPNIIREIADCYGSQCVVVAIDAKRNQEGKYNVFTHGGRKRTSRDAVTWAKEAAKLGAGELLLTSIDRDGTKSGFDIELNRMASTAVRIPVIASGGAGELQHFREVFLRGGVSAALAASIFHYQEYTIRELKDFLYQAGVAMRQ